MTYLGIDIGTSGVKALFIDRDGKPLGEATAKSVEPVRPHPGWSEQNPADWWNAVLEALDKLAAAHPGEMSAVRGIGLSGHMHGAVLLGASDEVLRPSILWNDGRSAAECAEMEAALPTLREIAGNIAMPGFTAPKIAWVRKHEPDVYGRLAKVLLPKAYVRLLLTGDHVEEMSDAAGTLWLDVAKRDWSDELLAVTGLTRDHMPRLVEGSAVSGTLKPDLARPDFSIAATRPALPAPRL
jgi:xylulokinase